MIALDTNVLVRYLVDDDAEQAEAARTLLEGLTSERPGFVCREVMVELVWVLQRAYGLSRDRIAAVLEALVAAEGPRDRGSRRRGSRGLSVPAGRGRLFRSDDCGANTGTRTNLEP